jgi:hypothetical protein
MFSATWLRVCVAFGGTCLFLAPESAEAQFVRRYAGGGVAVRAPFVRVDVGPYGETSVRAPFVAVDDPGAVYVGPGGRRIGRPGYAYGVYGAVPPGAMQQQAAPAPARPYPTPEQLAAMELLALVQELRVLDALLTYELGRFDRPEGWQRYLALPPDALGAPGDPEPAVRLDVLQRQLARFDKVAANEEFAKVAASPSFAATHAALRAVVERFGEGGPTLDGDPASEGGPALIPPQDEDFPNDPGPVTDSEESEQLPAPPPNPEPARMRSGERSILKQR